MPAAETSHPEELVLGVDGMSCGHCKAAVTEEVEKLEGVASLEVTLDTGEVRVRGEGVERAAVESAVERAGYEVRAA